jgi:hypothetical protein
MNFLRSLFSTTGALIGLYLIIGVAVNTTAPHLPSLNSNNASLEIHSWAQYVTSVVFWPLSFWHPTINVGKWTPGA